MTEHFDVVVIGGGLAGLTAGLVSARQGRTTLVLEATVPGGHLVNLEAIEDYPGFPGGIAGYELGPLVQEQAAAQGAEFQLAEVRRLAPVGAGWQVETADGTHLARAVILATGCRPRALDASGVDRLAGRGVSHCASCDGPLVRGQVVGVVGGGDSGCQEALTLTQYAARVILFEQSAALSAQQAFQRRIAADPRITVRLATSVEAVLGDERVTAVQVREPASGATETVPLAGLFVYAGLIPNTELIAELLPLSADGRVPTDAGLRTARPGLFAAGDLRADSSGQAVAAAGDGAAAAVAAHRYLIAADRANG